MIINEEDYDSYLSHYGTPRKSGRYPWGSGEAPNLRGRDFLGMYKDLKAQGLSDKEIYQGLGISSTQFRARRSIALAEAKQDMIHEALKLQEKQMSGAAAARQMGIPESTYRNLVKEGALDKARIHNVTADMLQAEVDAHGGPIYIGAGVENYLKISREKLMSSVGLLQEKGYTRHVVPVPQIGTGHDTDALTLCPPGWTQKDAWAAQANIKQIARVSEDGGRHWSPPVPPPISIDPKRVEVAYSEKDSKGNEIGGGRADGVIYVREGVKDLSMGENRYGQVRIKVGDGHYLKGMAMYRDDLPPGVDLLFNTSKTREDARKSAEKQGLSDIKLGAMKPLENNKTLPFGAVTRPLWIDGDDPKKARVESALNMVNEAGDWHKWNRNISAQALSKQPHSLAKQQLKAAYDARKDDYDQIMALTNPVVKKKLLEKFAESTDAAAVHLKAAALERQNWRVILPLDKLREGEVYAPGYKNGETVVLIRYPHGGTFEIPELRVNNRNPQGKALIRDSMDAIGIHHSVAERLSGADFDGDTVMIVPNNDNKLKHSSPLKDLKGFDPRALYRLPDDAPWLKPRDKQKLMGEVSNLITDMSIRGANQSELARAVKHSMVVIDAEKHHLDYKRSARDNAIAALKQQYQPKVEDPTTGRMKGGASTLISRAGSPDYRPDLKIANKEEGGPWDAEGRVVRVPSGKKNHKGELKITPYKKLSLVDDAHDLSSGHPVEKIYADHSNALKALANQARRSYMATPKMDRISNAAKTYHKEVASLRDKLDTSQKNAPLELQAQVIANSIYKQLIHDNPNLEAGTKKKMRYAAQEEARQRMGANKKKREIEITPKEWEAIQAGAIANDMLDKILKNTDLVQVRKYATPRPERVMDAHMTRRAAEMLARNATRAEVAEALGVSVSTLDRSLIADDVDDDDEY